MQAYWTCLDGAPVMVWRACFMLYDTMKKSNPPQTLSNPLCFFLNLRFQHLQSLVPSLALGSVKVAWSLWVMGTRVHGGAVLVNCLTEVTALETLKSLWPIYSFTHYLSNIPASMVLNHRHHPLLPQTATCIKVVAPYNHTSPPVLSGSLNIYIRCKICKDGTDLGWRQWAVGLCISQAALLLYIHVSLGTAVN